LALEQEVCLGFGTSSAANTRRAEAISAKVFFLEQLRNFCIMSQQVLSVKTMNNIRSVDFALPEVAININCGDYLIV